MPEGENTPGAETVQPEEGQGTATQADAVQGQQAQQPAEPQGGSGPWADKLESRFEDQAIRAQVDEFLKAEIQPYVTKLEQSQTDLPEEAKLLYNDLLENPAETYLAITSELYGPEAANAVKEALNQGATPEEAAAIGQEVADEGEGEDEPDPVLERMREDYLQSQATDMYNDELERVKAAMPEEDRKTFVDDWFHQFVVAADGDFDTAVVGYNQFIKQAQEKFGLNPDQIPEAPATIGSDSQTPSAPPTQKEYKTIDEALDDTLAEARAAKAPSTVGVV